MGSRERLCSFPQCGKVCGQTRKWLVIKGELPFASSESAGQGRVYGGCKNAPTCWNLWIALWMSRVLGKSGGNEIVLLC